MDPKLPIGSNALDPDQFYDFVSLYRDDAKLARSFRTVADATFSVEDIKEAELVYLRDPKAFPAFANLEPNALYRRAKLFFESEGLVEKEENGQLLLKQEAYFAKAIPRFIRKSAEASSQPSNPDEISTKLSNLCLSWFEMVCRQDQPDPALLRLSVLFVGTQKLSARLKGLGKNTAVVDAAFKEAVENPARLLLKAAAGEIPKDGLIPFPNKFAQAQDSFGLPERFFSGSKENGWVAPSKPVVIPEDPDSVPEIFEDFYKDDRLFASTYSRHGFSAFEDFYQIYLEEGPELDLKELKNARAVTAAFYEAGQFSDAVRVWSFYLEHLKSEELEVPSGANWLEFLKAMEARAVRGGKPVQTYECHWPIYPERMPLACLIGKPLTEKNGNLFSTTPELGGNDLELSSFIPLLAGLEDAHFSLESLKRMTDPLSRERLRFVLYALQPQSDGLHFMPPELRILVDPRLKWEDEKLNGKLGEFLKAFSDPDWQKKIEEFRLRVADELGRGGQAHEKDYHALITFLPGPVKRSHVVVNQTLMVLDMEESFNLSTGTIAHEWTHLQTGILCGLDGQFDFLSEGIAQWIEEKLGHDLDGRHFRPHYHPFNLEKAPDSFAHPDWKSGISGNLSDTWILELEARDYMIGYSFWKEVEEQLGSEQVLEIIREIEAISAKKSEDRKAAAHAILDRRLGSDSVRRILDRVVNSLDRQLMSFRTLEAHVLLGGTDASYRVETGLSIFLTNGLIHPLRLYLQGGGVWDNIFNINGLGIRSGTNSTFISLRLETPPLSHGYYPARGFGFGALNISAGASISRVVEQDKGNGAALGARGSLGVDLLQDYWDGSASGMPGRENVVRLGVQAGADFIPQQANMPEDLWRFWLGLRVAFGLSF